MINGYFNKAHSASFVCDLSWQENLGNFFSLPFINEAASFKFFECLFITFQ